MVENRPVERWPVWLLHFISPLPGGIAGAAVGFHLYFRRPGLNTDTLAPAILASAWALCGMLIGALLTSMAAWLARRLLRRWFSTSPLTTCALTLLCVAGLSLWLYAPLEARLPKVLWPPHQAEQSRPPPPSEPTCAREPPADLPSRKLWEQECR
jgi:hypothetical protein